MKKSTPLIAKWRRIISQLRCLGLPAVVQDQGIPYHHHQGRMSRLLGVIAVRTVEPRMDTVEDRLLLTNGNGAEVSSMKKDGGQRAHQGKTWKVWAMVSASP
jgi:hypothetical protein